MNGKADTRPIVGTVRIAAFTRLAFLLGGFRFCLVAVGLIESASIIDDFGFFRGPHSDVVRPRFRPISGGCR